MVPAIVSDSQLICVMPSMGPFVGQLTGIFLNLWDGIRQIDTGCSFEHHKDITV